MPKVSVITPVYNAAPYVIEALDSLLAQTWQDWEAVVVDDGSTDETPNLLSRYTDPRIKVIRQENGGEASARNTGLDAISGEYIGFLDADDLYLPEALQLLVEYLDSHPEMDVVFSDGFICNAEGQPLMRLTEQRPYIETGYILEPILASSSLVSVPVCTLTRRSAIQANGARFDRELVIGPDYDFWIQMARFSQFGYLDQLTCKYRVHQSNITRTSGLKKRKTDLLRGRLKILNSDWFANVSVPVRHLIFYELLISLLSGEPEEQAKILQTDAFHGLPAVQQADLLRQVAIDILVNDDKPGFAKSCLDQALVAFPQDQKSRLLRGLLSISRPFCVALLRFWQVVQRFQKKLQSSRKPHIKPVPAELSPVGK